MSNQVEILDTLNDEQNVAVAGLLSDIIIAHSDEINRLSEYHEVAVATILITAGLRSLSMHGPETASIQQRLQEGSLRLVGEENETGEYFTYQVLEG